ncbi:leucyl aminopeptidase [Curvibacter sp. APW13]|uniref:leucyl aminopeptidase n=1 Tax=Curvibacter sp. APW13 TaxID=3077236 RepID=UPI0028DDB539|nr:leucyl aminopeptidase [Curvibacter sp. APW13]MDT8991354.1 leucyl aminopeptidase [Curvibacter sp. APW13]
MNFELKTSTLAGLAQEKSDAAIVLVANGFQAPKGVLGAWMTKAIQAKALDTATGKVLSVYELPGLAAPRAAFAGVGVASAKDVRSALTAALTPLKSSALKKLTVAFAGDADEASVRAAVAALYDAFYAYTTTKSKAEKQHLQKVTLLVPNASACQTAFDRAVAIGEGALVAREWANRPANHATPTLLGKAAQHLAKGTRMHCEVLGPKEVAKLGMGSFMAVAQGSAEPLQFIVLRYQGAAKTQAPTVLVGKGITFDSGGISIKPAPEMDEMKFDMSGAASVLGTFKALSVLKPAINVVGLIPACENLPSSTAVKPGDVVTSMNGTTIEILNTDAEGRLVLCDALTYAERFNPSAVVDIATLTGACVIALGAVRSGVFSSDDGLANELLAAGTQAQDLGWRMPLDDEYADGLKSNFADVANVAGRPGGAITAAKFLHRFAAKYPWAHIDIAGTAWKGGAAKGATGRPVGMLVEFLLGRVQVK